MRFSIQKRELEWLHYAFRHQALVGLLAGRPRGIANLAGPCVVQPKVDFLRVQRDIVQRVL